VGRGAPPCSSQRYCEVNKAMSGLGTQARYNPSVSPKGEPPPFTQGRLRDWLPPGAGEVYPGWGYDPCREGVCGRHPQSPFGCQLPLKREPWEEFGSLGGRQPAGAAPSVTLRVTAPSKEGALGEFGSLGGRQPAEFGSLGGREPAGGRQPWAFGCLMIASSP